ncbi:ATPase P [Alicyclobacillus fastidiosus]|nr:ATPase P [Alicyclobacillus fastidiosus]
MFPTAGVGLLSVPSLLTMFLSRNTFKNGLSALINRRKANADTLSSVAIIASLIKGTPQSAIFILMISAFSEMLTELTASRARRSLSELMEGEVTTAWKVVDSETVKVSVNELGVEDEIYVFAGEKVPVDGTVLSGSGSIDESSITGEYLPRSIEPWGYVFAGSVLKEGCMLIRAERVGNQTAVRKMIKLIEESYEQKAPVQHVTDRLANRLVLVSFLMAGFVFMFTRNWDRTLNMLIVDFCCGLKLSTSTAFSASIAKAAQNGILIKGSQHIEKLTAIDTMLLDKTGTITEGRPEVLNVYGVHPGMETEVLMYAASVEKHSGHPVAEAIRREAKREKIHIIEPIDVETIIGKGIAATVKGERILVGSERFLRENDIKAHHEQNEIEGTPIYVAKQGALLGVVYIQDRIRSNMKKSLTELKEKYIRNIMMVTGDQRQSATLVSKQTGIKDYIFEALPEQKHMIVRQLQGSGRKVLMIGDGLNDGPALGRADVGVSMGSKRTALASEVSDITITSDDPLTLPALMELSYKTMGIVRNNIRFTIVLNAFAVIFGAMGMLSPVLSALIHNGATVAVVANSSRLLWLDMKHFRRTPRVIEAGRAKVLRSNNGESENLRSVVGL